MTSILLDTNSCTFLWKGDKLIQKQAAFSEKINLSAISLGELYLGFKGGNKEDENVRILTNFLNTQKVQIVKVDRKIAQTYGKIGYFLRRKGKPIPTNDIWIAASAIETNSVLVTYDRHFLNIPSLKLWRKLD